jgi:hypothetical protein
MDRKAFISTTVGGVAAAAAASSTMAAAAAPTQADIDDLSNRNIEFMRKIVGALVDDLNSDQHDYGGHRANAVAKLQQADSELQQAEAYVKAHGQ